MNEYLATAARLAGRVTETLSDATRELGPGATLPGMSVGGGLFNVDERVNVGAWLLGDAEATPAMRLEAVQRRIIAHGEGGGNSSGSGSGSSGGSGDRDREGEPCQVCSV